MGKLKQRYSEIKQLDVAQLMMVAYTIAPGEDEKNAVEKLCKALEDTTSKLARLVAGWQPAVCFESASLEEPEVGGLCASFKQDLISLELPHPVWMEYDPGVEFWNCAPAQTEASSG